jgi:putative ABC transport system substrate-binding protein
MIGRRQLLFIAAATAAAPARAQSPPLARIGWLSPRSATTERNPEAVRRGLEQLGFVEGRNLVIDFRFTEGDFGRLPALAEELVRLRPGVILATGGASPVRAIRAHSAEVPVVFGTGADPVGDGLVDSLSRPGRRTTGIWVFTSQLSPKRLELLRQIVPEPQEIAFLLNPRGTSYALQQREMAEALGSGRLTIFRASTPTELETAFAAMSERRVAGLLMGADTFFQVERARIVALAAQHRLPTMFEWPEFVKAGGLMSYSTATDETWLVLGTYAGRILKGEDAGSLPVVQSTTFELSLNLRTAKEQGLTIPPGLLARADEVIE